MYIFLGILLFISCAAWLYFLVRTIINWCKKEDAMPDVMKMLMACVGINLINLILRLLK
jgi:hypothetical protein